MKKIFIGLCTLSVLAQAAEQGSPFKDDVRIHRGLSSRPARALCLEPLSLEADKPQELTTFNRDAFRKAACRRIKQGSHPETIRWMNGRGEETTTLLQAVHHDDQELIRFSFINGLDPRRDRSGHQIFEAVWNDRVALMLLIKGTRLPAEALFFRPLQKNPRLAFVYFKHGAVGGLAHQMFLPVAQNELQASWCLTDLLQQEPPMASFLAAKTEREWQRRSLLVRNLILLGAPVGKEEQERLDELGKRNNEFAVMVQQAQRDCVLAARPLFQPFGIPGPVADIIQGYTHTHIMPQSAQEELASVERDEQEIRKLLAADERTKTIPGFVHDADAAKCACTIL